MSTSLTTIAGGGVIGLVLVFLTEPLALHNREFMTVHEVSYEGGEVEAVRTFHRDATADWTVTIVPPGQKSPICKTIPGEQMHAGWSDYERGRRVVDKMSLDVWVGDTGCHKRLSDTPYNMWVTWTPRDGTPAVKLPRVTFTPSGNP